MQASVLYFADCPNWPEAARRLRRALDDLGHTGVPIDYLRVDAGTATGFPGSPTILVDGTDLFRDDTAAADATRHVYRHVNAGGGSTRRACRDARAADGSTWRVSHVTSADGSTCRVSQGVSAAGGLTCRVYRGARGASGVPELADMVAALRGRTGS